MLNEIGLPQTEQTTGLLFFNVGVEIGQVIFAAVATLGIFLLKRAISVWTSAGGADASLQKAMGYAVGSTAAFWLVTHTVGFLDSNSPW